MSPAATHPSAAPTDAAVCADLAAFVNDAWERHAREPQAVTDALMARAGSLGADEAGAQALMLAEHVWLAHRHDLAGLQAFVQALTATPALSPACAAALPRMRWVLARAQAQTHGPAAQPALPDPGTAERWRGLQNLWALAVARGLAASALAELQAQLPLARAHDDAATRRALAGTCNNLAVELREGARGDAAVDELMLALAMASLELWGGAGTWLHTERAHYQLARCHAVLGDGPAALAHAAQCLALLDAHADAPEADAFERFFAHECLAWAHRAAGDGAAVVAQHAQMATLLAQVADPGLADWCVQALAALDALD